MTEARGLRKKQDRCENGVNPRRMGRRSAYVRKHALFSVILAAFQSSFRTIGKHHGTNTQNQHQHEENTLQHGLGVKYRLIGVMFLRLAFVTFTLCVAAGATPQANPTGDAIAAAQGLVSRLLGPDFVSKFAFEVIPPTPGADGFGYDTFEFEAAGNGSPVYLRGNSGVSIASALHWCAARLRLKFLCETFDKLLSMLIAAALHSQVSEVCVQCVCVMGSWWYGKPT
jgi:hypothetical protein